jgi:hypothetical protein
LIKGLPKGTTSYVVILETLGEIEAFGSDGTEGGPEGNLAYALQGVSSKDILEVYSALFGFDVVNRLLPMINEDLRQQQHTNRGGGAGSAAP